MSKRQIPNFAFVLFGLVTVCGGCTLQYHDIGSGQSETFALGQRSAVDANDAADNQRTCQCPVFV